MKRQQFMLTFQFPLFCIVGVQPQCKLGVFSYGSYHSDIKREEPKQNQRQITNKHATIRKYHTLYTYLYLHTLIIWYQRAKPLLANFNLTLLCQIAVYAN